MTFIISQLDKVEPAFLKDWIFVFGGLFGLFWMVWSFVKSTKKAGPTSTVISPDPLQVQEVEKLATKAELQEMSQRLRGDIDGLRRSIDDEKRTNYSENSKLHKRVDEVVETLAETKGLLIGVKENTDRLLERSMK